MTNEILGPTIQSLYLEIQFNDLTISSATGFLVIHNNKYYLITNRHNFTGRNNITNKLLDDKNASIPNKIGIWHNSMQLERWIKLIEPILSEAETPLWIEHPTLKEKADFVALPITQTDNVAFYPYSLDEQNFLDNELMPTDRISIVGFPFGETSAGKLSIWATGFIASEVWVDYANHPIFLVDSRTREGQSGSPVIFHRNPGAYEGRQGTTYSSHSTTKLLGIYSGRINENSDLGMVWKVKAIKELIDSIK